MDAGDLLNIRARNQYVEKVISRAIDRYRTIQVHNSTSREGERLEVNPNLLHLINDIFEEGINSHRDAKLIAGIAIETRRLDIVGFNYSRLKESSKARQTYPIS